MFERAATLRSLPSHLRLPNRASKLYTFVLNNLNFYRLHLLCFTFVPLITSGIMYGISTNFRISYIDCLFNCMSAFTVTGLATINLSTLSSMQQVLLFVQMTFGSLTFVSILMILVRLHFFRQKFKHVIQERQRQEQDREKAFSLGRSISRVLPTQGVKNVKRRLSMSIGNKDKSAETDYAAYANGNRAAGKGNVDGEDGSTPPSSFELQPVHPISSRPIGGTPPRSSTPKAGKKRIKINKDMIKRVDGGGVGMINPMGWYDDSPGHSPGVRTPAGGASPGQGRVQLPEIDAGEVERGRRMRELSVGQQDDAREEVPATASALDTQTSALGFLDGKPALRAAGKGSDDLPGPRFVTDSPPPMSDPDRSDSLPTKTPYAGRAVDEEAFPRAKTIAFDDGDDDGLDHDRLGQSRGFTSAREGGYFPRTATGRSVNQGQGFPRTGTTASGFPRTYSLHPSMSRGRAAGAKQQSKMSGFGGFPMPLEIGQKVFKKAFPDRHKTITQTLTMPRTNTIGRKGTIVPEMETEPEKEVPYISFAAVVGRNSRFTGLTEDQMEELGGVEYRALRVLLWIVIGYFLFVQLAAFVILTPYIMAGGRYEYVFDAQPQEVPTPWFTLFQAVSAFSNTGMSLADQSMLPFQSAYLMIALIVVLIFAGNTAYPVFLRFAVWMIYRLVPKTSRVHESLKFLLDHPRRCFVYLFPATQTWVLAIVMTTLYLLDFVCFLVLDIGTEEIQSIPVGTRIGAAFLQSAAVRAAGFAIVPLAALAPAVKVLYVIMMYVSVYPIALSVRATNVYEEKSLGLFEEDEAEDDEETIYGEKGAQAVAKYVGWHARRQLAFDIWWLGFALWLICIIERGAIVDSTNATWFNVFNVLFEIVSAYGTVGLSLGVPYDNFSFVGSWSTLGKLVVVLVMLRGRHRGLPVAIDRAVMLPKDFTVEEEQAFEEERSRRASRRMSSIIPDEYAEAFQQGQGQARGSISSPRRSSSSDPSGPGPRRTSSPGPAIHAPAPVPFHRRAGSMSSPGPSGGVVPSPSGLTFNLPRTDTRSRSPLQSMRASMNTSPSAHTGAVPSGQLSPVRESGLSRAPTLVPKE